MLIVAALPPEMGGGAFRMAFPVGDWERGKGALRITIRKLRTIVHIRTFVENCKSSNIAVLIWMQYILTSLLKGERL
ncbi:hypothetical protein LC613_15560 [Nostoc sphaeroides CHAB 2801]|uniref:hypothetical protein n=1 Tax=Nostoc sphaeroides TaxID=446679 RepID=UPI000E5428A0|nr:hypothetical protein [Nostoc sphaeroides]MCC5629405.1 hypothetical protein [Nostoc sphaeroides CHAB 2801]